MGQAQRHDDRITRSHNYSVTQYGRLLEAIQVDSFHRVLNGGHEYELRMHA